MFPKLVSLSKLVVKLVEIDLNVLSELLECVSLADENLLSLFCRWKPSGLLNRGQQMEQINQQILLLFDFEEKNHMRWGTWEEFQQHTEVQAKW